MRSQFFTAEESGLSRSQLRWGEHEGRWRKAAGTVYVIGPDVPTPLDRALAVAVATGGTASGSLAGVLFGLDSIVLRQPDVTVTSGRSHARTRIRRRELPPDRVTKVFGFPCTDALQTLIDLAAEVSDDVWEQALESALRKRLVTVDALEAELPELGRARVPGTRRIRSVLERRPVGAPPTESLLETLFLQLARRVPGLGEPVRQLVITDAYGEFVARLDLAWPELGMFSELDGQQHRGQPVYDARRETAVVAATGWLPGRFTWDEVTRHPVATARRLEAVVRQARGRGRTAAAM